MNKKRVAAVTAAAVVILALGGTTIYGLMQTQKYQRSLQYNYERSMSDLRDSVDNISTTLGKAQYANTATEQNGLAAELMRESTMAKASIASLPLTGNSLNNVTKFVSQVGDFSVSLSKKISEGQKISADDSKSMQSLVKYSQTLQKDLTDITPDFTQTNVGDSFKQTADDFTDFPSLIYDGPFSDNIGRTAPKMTQGKAAVSQSSAQNIAAAFLGISPGKLTHEQDTAGNLPLYNFSASSGNIRVAVTKAGGYVATMSNTRAMSDLKLDYKAALAKAKTFLDNHGVSNMKDTYYAISDGICMINFAYMQDNIICYPDLIKVGVALDTGEVVRYQAAGYIMNHTSRTLTLKLTQAEAQKSVSPSLTVKQGRPALIPTPGLNEVLCYEFLCSGKANDNVLVYINAGNGFEEDILILQQSDNGVLTK